MNIKLVYASIIDEKISSFVQALMEIFNFYFGCVTYGPPCIIAIGRVCLFAYRNRRQSQKCAPWLKTKHERRDRFMSIDERFFRQLFSHISSTIIFRIYNSLFYFWSIDSHLVCTVQEKVQWNILFS
jgi:hypothetical protein